MNNQRLRVLIISKDLNEQGGVVNVVAMLMNNFSNDIECHHFPFGRLQTSRGKSRIFKVALDMARLVRMVCREEWGCIHLNPSLGWRSLIRDTLVINLINKLCSRNILVFLHGWDVEVASLIKRNKILRRWVVNSFNRASLVLVLASQFKKELERIGVSPSRIDFISTMFDGQLFDRNTSSDHGETRVIVFLSRFIKEKGVYELLEAFKTLSAQYIDLQLVMAGDGPERRSMETWVINNGLAGRVDFRGYLKGHQKAEILFNSDVFVFPTYYGEGCPVSLLEAMAAGIPIITTPVGGIPDIFDDGQNGILLDEVSPIAIQRAVKKLLENKDQSRKIGACNREKAWKNYEASIVAEKLESLYRKVAGIYAR